MTLADISERRQPGNLADQGFTGAARSIKAPTGSAIGGRPSSAGSIVGGLFGAYRTMSYMLPFEALDYIEVLATYNPDYSQAVENIKTLANSGHELFVDAGSPLQQRRIRDLLEEKARTVQERHGGIDGLIDKLLDQAAVFGAMCGEWILSDDLTEVVDFVDINPKTIRFFWEESTQHWAPYQKVTHWQEADARRAGQATLNGCVKLNETTFHYYAFDAAPGSPYGTPPFLAALENIGIQRDMVANMSQIVKKIGLLGIIDVVVKALPAKPGESAEDYMARAGAYLDSYVEVVQNMVRDGGIVHFDDMETKSTNIAGNAAGATAIFKQNEELIFSGLKSMPSVQGRSYSTTETYAGVAYDIIIRNTKSYQRGCKRMIESGYWLMATLAGLQPTKISLKFNDNKTLHRLQDAQAEAVEIRNALVKWLCGIIDQMGFAQELGYNDVKKEMEEPPPEALGEKPSPAQGDSPGPAAGQQGNSSGNGTAAQAGEGDDSEEGNWSTDPFD